ncbi:LOW QUALITY PROTEIN: hormone-sensitive lipase [Anser cygnoides]|uniref:LOW QUALITY PROTEIN: hormone-sensitive lipase n=1 Tax=Anser cygnoides TaxID=8845 RepID=UPI0034D1D6FD
MEPSPMDPRPLFQSLAALADDNAAFFQRRGTAAGLRFAAAFAALREHGLPPPEPALRHFQRLQHRFDLDEATPGNGYRSLATAARRCLAHAVAKSRYVASHRRSLFFRAGHNAAELEAYGAALAQLRALLCLAQRVLARSEPGCLFPPEESGLSEAVLKEYSTMHNGCFYGRCLGFQVRGRLFRGASGGFRGVWRGFGDVWRVRPSIRPVLQTIAIGLVSFGEHYQGARWGWVSAAAELAVLGGRYALDPELRGAEFERLTQNLEVGFWKSFWNLTESQLLASVASVGAAPLGLCRVLAVPPEPLELPLVGGAGGARGGGTVTIAPPVAHSGPAPVHMRLLSYHLREGQDSPALQALSRPEPSLSPPRWFRGPPLPPSPALLVHFHGGGVRGADVALHEPYLRGWARDLGAPILSVDYALAPEAPFPRALEECFYAYCWALRHCRMLGSTAQRVCLAGDSAGGNLCLTVALRAAAVGVQPPPGVVAAYPVTLVQAAVSPSRLLTLLDPLLPLGVLVKCLSAYTGTGGGSDGGPEPPPEAPGGGGGLLQQLRQGAAAWLGGLLRGGAAGSGGGGAPPSTAPRKSLAEPPPGAPEPPASGPKEEEEEEEEGGGQGGEAEGGAGTPPYPDEFQPLRSGGPPARFWSRTPPLARNPYVSPLLAPDGLLGGLPPVHLVACELDPMLDDSVAFARRLRALGRPVTLRVVPDLPHGFLSLAQLCPETRRAAALCTRLIRRVLQPPALAGDLRRGSVWGDPDRRASVLGDPDRRASVLGDPTRRGSILGDPTRRGSTLGDPTRRASILGDPTRRGVGFGGSHSTWVNVGGPNSKGFDFGGPNSKGVGFGGSRSARVDFGGSAAGVDFGGPNSKGVNVGRPNSKGGQRWETQLEGLRFWGTQLEGGRFWGIPLNVGQFWGTQLEGGRLWGTQLEGGQRWPTQLNVGQHWGTPRAGGRCWRGRGGTAQPCPIARGEGGPPSLPCPIARGDIGTPKSAVTPNLGGTGTPKSALPHSEGDIGTPKSAVTPNLGGSGTPGSAPPHSEGGTGTPKSALPHSEGGGGAEGDAETHSKGGGGTPNLAVTPNLGGTGTPKSALPHSEGGGGTPKLAVAPNLGGTGTPGSVPHSEGGGGTPNLAVTPNLGGTGTPGSALPHNLGGTGTPEAALPHSEGGGTPKSALTHSKGDGGTPNLAVTPNLGGTGTPEAALPHSEGGTGTPKSALPHSEGGRWDPQPGCDP